MAQSFGIVSSRSFASGQRVRQPECLVESELRCKGLKMIK